MARIELCECGDHAKRSDGVCDRQRIEEKPAVCVGCRKKDALPDAPGEGYPPDLCGECRDFYDRTDGWLTVDTDTPQTELEEFTVTVWDSLRDIGVKVV